MKGLKLDGPVALRPIVKERVWGVERLPKWYPQPEPGRPVGEAWLTAAECEAETGETLGELARGNPAAFGGPFALHIGGDGGPGWQPGETFMNGHAENGQHGQVPVHGVGVKRFSRHGQIVKGARAFTDLIEADQFFPGGEPRE